MCCCGGWWPVIRALFLVADMGSDCLNVWDYHNKAYEKNNNETNFLSSRFYEHLNKNSTGTETVLESYYFIISFSAMLLPMAIATICLLIYLLYVYFMDIRQFFINSCCNPKCGKVFGTIASSLILPLTFILCVVISILVIFLSWIVSPLLHIFFAFFIAFGNNPAGKNDSKMKSLTWKKFATLMMFLSIVETLFEAVPQAILGICLSINQLKHSSLLDNESGLMHLWETYPYQVVSLIFSFCSVVKTLGTVAYQTTNDWDNSIFGMVTFLKDRYKETKAKKEEEEEIKMLNDQIKHLNEKEEEIKKLNDQIKHLHEDKQILTHQKTREKEEEIEMLNDQLKHLNEDKQKTIDFNNRFNANLKISGFETGNEMERGRFLKDVGIPPELLFDKGSFTDKSCVLTDLTLAESLDFMNTLHGKKYNDSALNINCSIDIVESKIPSSTNLPSIMPLPISEEATDVQHTQLLNGDIKDKKAKKEENNFSVGRSKTDSNSDFKLLDKINEEDVENKQLLNGDIKEKDAKKEKSRFPFWRSKTKSKLDHSDMELQNSNNEDDIENAQLLNGDPKKKNRFPFWRYKTTSQLDHSENKNDVEVQNTDAKNNEVTNATPPTSCSKTTSQLDHSENKNDEEVQNTDAKNNEENSATPPTSCPKTTSQLDHSENKNDEEVQNTDAQNNEETSGIPPPSCPSTPTLLSEPESQNSDTESTQEINKEEHGEDNS